MSQSKSASFIEAIVNVLIGFWVNFAANLLILPLVGFNISLRDNFVIGLIYTVISVARSYILRRWFNSFIVAAAAKLARTT